MTRLQDLPPELLNMIFSRVGDVDLPGLLVCQSLCRRVQAAIRSILARPVGEATAKTRLGARLAIHPALFSRFGHLFVADHSVVSNDKNQAYRTLPWAHSSETREPYLRPEASWRRLSVTHGRPPITRLDIVKMFTVYGGTSLRYYQVDVSVTGFTMGDLYDLLLGSESNFGGSTYGWQLLLGQRLEYIDDLHRLGASRNYPTKDDICSILVKDAGVQESAVLIVTGGRGCTRRAPKPQPEDIWKPNIIGRSPPKCLPIQYCSPPPRSRN